MSQTVWVTLSIIALVVALVLARAAFLARRPVQKAIRGSGAFLMLVASCLGFFAAIALSPTPPARLVIAPAPVPASLTLITEQAEDHGAGYKIVALHARDGSLAWQRDVAVYHQYTVSG